MSNREEMDEACKRAWARRGDAIEIIRREMYARTRKEALAARPEFVVSDRRAEYLEGLGLWFDLD